jgi:drug/metabolite transporter (DMT)-like permease
MVSSILLLPLIAAALHATWNALVKTAADRLASLALIALATTLIGLAMLPFVAVPQPAAWPYIVLSMLWKYAYYAFIYFAYRVGDLSLVYPLARGAAPLLVAGGAALIADEMLSPPALVGVLIACLGISGLTLGNLRQLRGQPLPFVLAIGTSLVIAAYTVCDGIGVRLSHSAFGFIAVLSVLEFPVVLVAIGLRRRQLAATFQSSWRQGMAAGVCSAVAYGLVVYAAAFAPLSIVSALRESSVIMAALIGTLVLGERPWQDRVAASALVAGGVGLMTAFR